VVNLLVLCTVNDRKVATALNNSKKV